ncbi:MAG: uridine kinase [Gemmatimonadota bacterium]
MVLAVAGGSGSGKSTVVREVRRILGKDTTVVLHHDAYYRDLSHLPPVQRATVNFDHPESLETELMVEHVRALLEGRPVQVPLYDFANHVRLPDTEPLLPRPVIILDGILVLADARLRELSSLKVFVDTEPDVRLIRRIRRDVRKRGRTVESVITQYEKTVRPMHLEFVEPSKRHADLIVPEGGYNRVAVDMVVTRLRNLLQERGPGSPRQAPTVR